MAAERCSVGRGVSAVRHRSGSRSYTYYAMKSLRSAFDQFEAEGTVFGSISKKDFHDIQQIVPPADVVTRFESVSFPLDERIAINAALVETLSDLRDTILPCLISGKLRVPDADPMLAEAAV